MITNELINELKTKVINNTEFSIVSNDGSTLFGVKLMNDAIDTIQKELSPEKPEYLIVNVDLMPILLAIPKYIHSEYDFDFTGAPELAGHYEDIRVIVAFEPVLGSGKILGVNKQLNKASLVTITGLDEVGLI